MLRLGKAPGSNPVTASQARGWPRRSVRRLCLLLVAQVLAVIVVTELGLRVARGHSPSLRRQLYMAGLPTRYDEAHTLRQLMEASPHGFLPYRRHGDSLGDRRATDPLRRAGKKLRTGALWPRR